MKIKDFVNTEIGKKYKNQLKGCDKNWECEYYENDDEYIELLKDNGWSNEDIEEQLLSSSNKYKLNENDNDYVIVIN